MTIPQPTPKDLAIDLANAYAWSVGGSGDTPAPGLLPAIIRRAIAAEAEARELRAKLADIQKGVADWFEQWADLLKEGAK